MSLFQQRRVRMLSYLAMVSMLLISIILIVLTVNGYGTLHLEGIPATAAISINGHTTKATSLKLRPGSYQLIITSPATAPLASTINVSLWQQTTYKPALQIRSADAITRSLLGAIPNTSTAPRVARLRWFQSNTWLAGTLAPTDTVFVAHYDTRQQKWVIALCNAYGYPSSTDNLPSEVVSYVQPFLAGGV